VASGDTLWAIAKKHLGSGNRWPEIYEANRKVIGDNPDRIKPGQVLTIPDSTAPGGKR
jgi:nucleoid-associated protein YgaU